MDDIVVYGRPSVDERMISGELVPVERTERDRVTATTTESTRGARRSRRCQTRRLALTGLANANTTHHEEKETPEKCFER